MTLEEFIQARCCDENGNVVRDTITIDEAQVILRLTREDEKRIVKENSEFLISTDTAGITISNLYRHNNLMMAGEKQHGWINIYKCGITSYIYPTEKQALSNVDPEGYSATIKIEWQE